MEKMIISIRTHRDITGQLFKALNYDKMRYMENAMKKIIIFLTIPLIASCATLKPAAPEATVTPIEQMSTYQLQNEYIEIDHKINELERKIKERKSSHGGGVNIDFAGNPAILLVFALNAYSMNYMETKIERYRLRLSDITKELSKRGMY